MDRIDATTRSTGTSSWRQRRSHDKMRRGDSAMASRKSLYADEDARSIFWWGPHHPCLYRWDRVVSSFTHIHALCDFCRKLPDLDRVRRLNRPYRRFSFLLATRTCTIVECSLSSFECWCFHLVIHPEDVPTFPCLLGRPWSNCVGIERWRSRSNGSLYSRHFRTGYDVIRCTLFARVAAGTSFS